jgi:hypothetical protein
MHMKANMLNTCRGVEYVLDGLNVFGTLHFPSKIKLIITKDDTLTCSIHII